MANNAPDYVMTVRSLESNGSFGSDVNSDATFVEVPQGHSDYGQTMVVGKDAWYSQVIGAAKWTNAASGAARGDILFIVHGYNMSTAEVLDRHRRIRRDLETLSFKGVIVSFDWPTEQAAIAYMRDRHAAKETAFRLVDEGIAQLAARQTPTCSINIHILCHSTGALVLREAFDDADDTQLPNSSWNVSQIIFAAGDVSSISMSDSDCGAEAVYRHCIRLTNYSNHYDEALDLSNVKRVGTAPRVGRIGLPDDAPAKAVNVDCTAYYHSLDTNDVVSKADQPEGRVGCASHSWYFGNRVFAIDLFQTIIGVDRSLPDTREPTATTDRFVLIRP
ncbi:alpha/beta hydrolase [Burkholderia pyrrocinia]